MGARLGGRAGGLPGLQATSLDALARNIGRVSDLRFVPEELVLLLLMRVLELGRLTPSSLEVFERSGHEQVLAEIARLGITSWVPPLVPTSREAFRW